MDDAQRKGRITFLALIAVFMIPIFASLIAFYFFPKVFTDGGKAKGNLLTPAHLSEKDGVPSVGLKDLSGNPVHAKAYKGRWTVLYVSRQQCDDECRRNLYSAGQAYILLASSGRSSQRARYMYIREGQFDLVCEKREPLLSPEYMNQYTNGSLYATLKDTGFLPSDLFDAPCADKELLRPHEYLKVYTADDLSPWLAALKVDDVDPRDAKRTYLVDPHGRVMMWYPSLTQPGAIKDDWKHLIKKKR